MEFPNLRFKGGFRGLGLRVKDLKNIGIGLKLILKSVVRASGICRVQGFGSRS